MWRIGRLQWNSWSMTPLQRGIYCTTISFYVAVVINNLYWCECSQVIVSVWSMFALSIFSCLFSSQFIYFVILSSSQDLSFKELIYLHDKVNKLGLRSIALRKPDSFFSVPVRMPTIRTCVLNRPVKNCLVFSQIKHHMIIIPSSLTGVYLALTVIGAIVPSKIWQGQ